MNSASEQGRIGTAGRLINTVTQVSQDESTLTSQVRVQGFVQSLASGRVFGAGRGSWILGFHFYQGNRWPYNLDPGEQMVFIDHTFACRHSNRGDLTVNFQVNFGFTGKSTFGNNQSQWTQLVLDHIKAPPTAPQNVQATNLTPNSVTVSWQTPSDGGGYDPSTIQYVVKRYLGHGMSGTPLAYPSSPSKTRNFTDLVPGQQYTYVVYAINKAKYNKGYSLPSAPLYVTANTGIHIRHSGSWVTVIPYVRNAGVWSPATPFVRKDGVWETTN
ncbi:MAG TPA: fibronectin type III domain-containing protein [Scandinavium sp.]|jgi:hypothetical protein